MYGFSNKGSRLLWIYVDEVLLSSQVAHKKVR